MSYVPVIIPTSDTQTTDRQGLQTAIKLLAGEGCERDAQQAHLMLVELSESKMAEVASDAQAILDMGAQQGWFALERPAYSMLRHMAARTLAKVEQQQRMLRFLVPLLAGSAVLLFLLVIYFFLAGGEPLF